MLVSFEPKFYLNWQEITGLDAYDEFFRLSGGWWRHFGHEGEEFAFDMDVSQAIQEEKDMLLSYNGIKADSYSEDGGSIPPRSST